MVLVGASRSAPEKADMKFAACEVEVEADVEAPSCVVEAEAEADVEAPSCVVEAEAEAEGRVL